jgi:hypothetical protein
LHGRAAAREDTDAMSDEHEKRASELAKQLFDKFSDVINTESEPWMAVDAEKEPERAALEKQLWGKALLCALAQQLGVIEAALIMGDGLDSDEVQSVREMWVRAGHRICMNVLEAQKAEAEEN